MADGDADGGNEDGFQILLGYCGTPPLLDHCGLNIILHAVAVPGDGKHPCLPTLDFFMERNDITRIDKIDALELAGAILLGYDENHEKFPLAFQYWRRALELRLMDTGDCRPIYKTPLKSKSGQLTEWSTLDDLLRIEQQPEQRKIQSLLVRLRIFSGICWRAVHRHFFFPILDFLRSFLTALPTEESSMREILDISWIALDAILRSDRPHEIEVQTSLTDIASLVLVILGHTKLNSENLKRLVELVLMTDPSYLTDPNMDAPVAEPRHLQILCAMMMIISRHPELVTEEILLSLLQLVHRDGRDSSGFNLLHTVSCARYRTVYALSTVRLLVKLGAVLNAVNNVGDGVLHILTQEPASETRDATAQLLVDLGAHLDMANKDGKTAADLWFQTNTPEKKDVADLPNWLQEGVPKLMCLSSRVIRRHKLPYDDGSIVPAVLVPFVSLH